MLLSSSYPWSESSSAPLGCDHSLIACSVKVKQSQTLVLDAGHIFVGSKLADKGQLQEVQSKRGRQYNEDDYKQLEVLMYDRLDLRLESTQVCGFLLLDVALKA